MQTSLVEVLNCCHAEIPVHLLGCKPMARGVTWNTNTTHQGLWQWSVCYFFWPADIHDDMRKEACLHLTSHRAHVKHCAFTTPQWHVGTCACFRVPEALLLQASMRRNISQASRRMSCLLVSPVSASSAELLPGRSALPKQAASELPRLSEILPHL